MLIVVCLQQQRMLLLDSLASTKNWAGSQNIYKFLNQIKEEQVFNSNTLPISYPKVQEIIILLG